MKNRFISDGQGSNAASDMLAAYAANYLTKEWGNPKTTTPAVVEAKRINAERVAEIQAREKAARLESAAFRIGSGAIGQAYVTLGETSPTQGHETLLVVPGIVDTAVESMYATPEYAELVKNPEVRLRVAEQIANGFPDGLQLAS